VEREACSFSNNQHSAPVEAVATRLGITLSCLPASISVMINCLTGASFPSALPSMFLTTVKSRMYARFQRNSNGLFILYNDRSFIEFGFVRHVFGG